MDSGASTSSTTDAPAPPTKRSTRSSLSSRDSLAPGSSGSTNQSVEAQLTLDDILVVSPFNAQVSRLLERLPAGARVGTVDKFQGQEAPVVNL